MAEVDLDCLDRDVESLRDLLVASPLGRELCYAPLAHSEGVEPRQEHLSRRCACGGKLVVRAPGEPECADPLRQVEALHEVFACLRSPVRAAEGCAQVDEGARVLEPRFCA